MERDRWHTPDRASPAATMLPKTTLLTRHVDDDRQREDEKGQESKGRSHGVPIWSTTLPRTRLSQHASACYAHDTIYRIFPSKKL